MWQPDHPGISAARDAYKDDPTILPLEIQEKLSEEEYEQQSKALWAIHDRNILIDEGKVPGNILVKDEHTDGNLHLGVGGWKYETGIGVTPEQSAFLSGMEDQILDPWRGAAQILKEMGIADLIDTEVQDKEEDHMRRLYGDEALGNSALGGGITGAVGEPMAWLLPFSKAMKAKSLFNVWLGSSALGAVYGGSMYVDKEESRLTNALVTAALMGPLSAGMAKYFRHAVGDDAVNAIQKAAIAEDVASPGKIIPGTEHKPYSYREFAESLEVGNPRRLTRKGEKKKKRGSAKNTEGPSRGAGGGKPKPEPKKNRKQREHETEEGLEVKANFDGRKQGLLQKIFGKGKDELGETGSIFNRAMEPVYDSLRKLSSRAAAQLRIADGTQHILARKWTDRTMAWTKWYEKSLKPAQQAALKFAINNQGLSKATMTMIHELGGAAAVKEAKMVQAVLAEIKAELKTAGYRVGHIPSYHPNSVADMDGMLLKRASQIDKAVAKARAAKGSALTQNEKAHVAQRLFEFDIRYSSTSGSLKQRKKMNITEDEIGFYHSPTQTLHNYISSMSEDIAKRRFFKGFGHKPHKTKGLNPSGADIDDSILSLVDRIQKDVPDMKGQNAVTELLRARFGPDVHKTHRFVQAAKNLSFAGTLGNWWSAMTQVGDVVFVGHKYGILNASAAVLGPRITNKEMLGLTKAMQELVSGTGGITNKIADWAFKWSGFSKIDAFGKTAHMNASLRLNKKMAKNNPEKFNKTWNDYFGPETEALRVELANLELKKGAKLSDNAYLMLWNDLADTQPIGLSEMPMWYLLNPNGRVAYAYKTFAMKQFNYMRKLIQDKNRPIAARTADLVYFSSMFVMANTGIDVFKDYMAGGDLDIEDIALDNLFTLALTSKYAVDKSAGLGSAIAESLQPVPYTQLTDVINNISQGDTTLETVVDQLPIAGALNRKGFTDIADEGFISKGLEDMF